MSPISNEITANDPLLFAMLTVSERRSDSVSVPGEFEAAEARVKVTPLVIADPLQLVPGKFAQRMVGAPSATFESAIGTTVVIPGALNTLSYRSCIDQANGQSNCPGTPPLSTAFVTPSITAIGSSNASDDTLVTTLKAPYSMTEELDITLLPGSVINYSASSRLIANVPEPASLTLLGSALIGVGWLGRRRRKAA